MKDYKRGSHTVWDCKYHLVWATKYRYQVLSGDVGERCRELLREIAICKEMLNNAGSINRDHVHMLIGIDTATICFQGSSVFEGEEFSQIIIGVKALKEALLGIDTQGFSQLYREQVNGYQHTDGYFRLQGPTDQ